MKSLFNNHLKASLENHKVEYNPAHWADLESRLNAIDAAKSTSGAGKKILLSSAAVIVVAGLTYFFINNQSETNKKDNTSAQLQTISLSDETTSLPVNINANTSQESANTPVEINLANHSSGKIISENVKDETLVVAEKKEQPIVSNNIPENKINTSVQPEVAAVQPPSASFHCNKNMVCLGSQVQFTNDNNPVPCTYQWDFGDGEFSSDPNPVHIFKDPGAYNVKLRVVSKKDNKADEQAIKNILIVHPIPSIDISTSASAENYSVVNFEGRSEDAITWNWDFGNKKTSSEQSPSHSFNKKGNYQVVLTAKNKFGCSASYNKNVYIEHDYNLLAPSGFSPNGDGLNDTWIPASLVSGDYIFNLTIFDKAGNVAYITSDKMRPWDGRNAKTGYFAKMGEMFLWKATVQEGNGKVSTYDGYIIIADSK